VGVDGSDALVGTGFQQLGAYDLLNGEDDAILGADTDGGAAILYCLDRIFDLEVSTVGGEDGVEQVVACSYGRLMAEREASALGLRGMPEGWDS
jgi:hypothetical protein